MRRQFGHCYWPTRRRQRDSSDVITDVVKKEERALGAVRASDEARDDHMGCLRLPGAGSKQTHTQKLMKLSNSSLYRLGHGDEYIVWRK